MFQTRLDFCPMCTSKRCFISHRKLRVISGPVAISPCHHMDKAVWPQRFEATSVTLVDPKVALKQVWDEVTSSVSWTISAYCHGPVGNYCSWHGEPWPLAVSKTKTHDLQTPILNASFVMLTVIKIKQTKKILTSRTSDDSQINTLLARAQLDYILCW